MLCTAAWLQHTASPFQGCPELTHFAFPGLNAVFDPETQPVSVGFVPAILAALQGKLWAGCGHYCLKFLQGLNAQMRKQNPFNLFSAWSCLYWRTQTLSQLSTSTSKPDIGLLPSQLQLRFITAPKASHMLHSPPASHGGL